MEIQALFDSMARHGVKLPRVAIEPDDRAGRRVTAASDIREGETVLAIPDPAILTLDLARKSAIGKQMREADMDLPSGHSYLAAYLLQERKRPDSPFAAYLGTLPTRFPTVPLYSAKELLPYLRGSFAGSLIVRRKETICRDYLELRDKVPAFRDVTLKDYFWARTTVVTRVFGVKMRGASTEAMVPLADMINHKRPPAIDWTYDDEKRAFVMTASRDIAKGEELVDSYGRKPNGRFFVHYGFALESGADDEIEVHLALPKGDAQSAAKTKILRRLGGPEGDYRLTNKLRNDDTQRTFTFLRACAASGSEIARVAKLVEESKPVPALSARNEISALAMLDRACAASLAKFDSPDEAEDLELLSRPDLTVNVRNAILVRRGEKRLLKSFRTLVGAAIPLLRLPRKHFFSAAVHEPGEALTCSYLMETALALAPREARPPSFKSIGL
ncbi:MAG: SET domain-containing histone-lysine N-methyltransferase [Polyangiaceae bacterium]